MLKLVMNNQLIKKQLVL